MCLGHSYLMTSQWLCLIKISNYVSFLLIRKNNIYKPNYVILKNISYLNTNKLSTNKFHSSTKIIKVYLQLNEAYKMRNNNNQ